MEVSQECSDSSVATGIRTVTTGLQICLGKRATFLNNEIGPYCDNPLNAPVIRKVAILDGSLDLIKCLSAASLECVTSNQLELRITWSWELRHLRYHPLLLNSSL